MKLFAIIGFTTALPSITVSKNQALQSLKSDKKTIKNISRNTNRVKSFPVKNDFSNLKK